MSLKDELSSALKDAMRASDDGRKIPLRLVISAIQLAQVEKGSELDDTEVMGIIQKEVKARRESIADAEKAKRDDLVEAAQAEMVVLESFLPKGLTVEELEAIVRAAIAEAGATSPADMGAVMKLLVPKTKGRADGGQVSALVRQLLQG
ncbi:MAG: GatB/YqeY domain-containing protein [Anaerolineae bacterium]|nr:MAG: GatB/YqeY domain-containing protein [Anaerolineae bacterium]